MTFPCACVAAGLCKRKERAPERLCTKEAAHIWAAQTGGSSPPPNPCTKQLGAGAFQPWGWPWALWNSPGHILPGWGGFLRGQSGDMAEVETWQSFPPLPPFLSFQIPKGHSAPCLASKFSQNRSFGRAIVLGLSRCCSKSHLEVALGPTGHQLGHLAAQGLGDSLRRVGSDSGRPGHGLGSRGALGWCRLASKAHSDSGGFSEGRTWHPGGPQLS